MKEGLIDKIRGYGFWRVNIRPLVDFDERLTLQQCIESVDAAHVSLRGWDFPHVSIRNDEHGGISRLGEYVEDWCDWHVHIEFWRMYRSGQFLTYRVLWEDLVNEGGGPLPADVKVLSPTGAIYSITEFVEFTRRLYNQGLYEDGVLLSVSLQNNAGRQLRVDRGRVGFIDEKRSDAEVIELSRELEVRDLADGQRTISIDLLLELFDHFGWQPQRSQIEADQDRLFRRDLF